MTCDSSGGMWGFYLRRYHNLYERKTDLTRKKKVPLPPDTGTLSQIASDGMVLRCEHDGSFRHGPHKLMLRLAFTTGLRWALALQWLLAARRCSVSDSTMPTLTEHTGWFKILS